MNQKSTRTPAVGGLYHRDPYKIFALYGAFFFFNYVVKAMGS